MNITHAKAANRRESDLGNMTKDYGLKHPCECVSGKKFKHCCFAIPTTGWGWVRLYQEGFGLVAFRVDEQSVPGASPEMIGAALVPVYASYQVGMKTAAKSPAAKPTYLVRMPIEDLRRHIRQQFAPGSNVVLHVPAEVSEAGETELFHIVVQYATETPDVQA